MHCWLVITLISGIAYPSNQVRFCISKDLATLAQKNESGQHSFEAYSTHTFCIWKNESLCEKLINQIAPAA